MAVSVAGGGLLWPPEAVPQAGAWAGFCLNGLLDERGFPKTRAADLRFLLLVSMLALGS